MSKEKATTEKRRKKGIEEESNIMTSWEFEEALRKRMRKGNSPGEEETHIKLIKTNKI